MAALTEFGNMLPLEGAALGFCRNFNTGVQFKAWKQWCRRPLSFLPSLPFPLVNLEDQGHPEDQGHLWVPKNRGTDTNEV